jgi:transposase
MELETDEKTCRKCGKGLNPRQAANNQLYCSRECYADARWGDVIRCEGIETRRPLVIAAAKLCKSGLTQTQAARQLGVSSWQIAGWIRRYGAENFMLERICEHWGKSLSGMRPLSNRKYCSRSCRAKAGRARRYMPAPSGRQKLKFDPALRMQALALYWDGLGRAEIAQCLDVACGTVCSWVFDFGDLRERRKPTRQRLREAQTAGEWLEALRDAAPLSQGDPPAVRLVCGELRGNCGMNRLVTTITEALRQNPFGGDTFAFCNMMRNTIYTITWKQPVFHIVRLPKMYGCYVWPRIEFGPFIEIAQNEFEYLLSFCKRPCEAQKNLDLSRFL